MDSFDSFAFRELDGSRPRTLGCLQAADYADAAGTHPIPGQAKIRVVEKILECAQEAQLRPLPDIERLAYTEVINCGARPDQYSHAGISVTANIARRIHKCTGVKPLVDRALVFGKIAIAHAIGPVGYAVLLVGA